MFVNTFYFLLILIQFQRIQSVTYVCNNYEDDTDYQDDNLTPVPLIQKTKEGL